MSSSSPSRPALEAELDRLYQRPLGEFVAARNALAKELKSAGEAEAARDVKALVKPSASAWAVNQLYFRDREAFDRLVASGDACRRAQGELLAGRGEETLAQAEESRREAVENARRRVEALLREAGEPSGPAVLRRAGTTLEALASFGSANPEPWNGRASEDLEAPGFRALSGLAVASPRVEETALAENRLPEAERARAAAVTALDEAEARAHRLRNEVREQRERLARLETELGAAEADVEGARASVRATAAELSLVRSQKSGGDGAR